MFGFYSARRPWAVRMLGFAALASALVVTGAVAQSAKKESKAPNVGTQAAQPQSAWVKVCEAATFKIDGKEEKKNVCLTHHERLDANTGMVLVSAAIREIEGQPKPALIVMLAALRCRYSRV